METASSRSGSWKISGQNEIEHGSVVAGRTEQHKTMPDRVLKAQPPPRVKDNAETIEQAAGDNQTQRQMRQRRQAGIVGNQPAPAHRQIETHRYPVEAPREKKLQHNPDRGHAPDTG